jgi:hypothetical protein
MNTQYFSTRSFVSPLIIKKGGQEKFTMKMQFRFRIKNSCQKFMLQMSRNHPFVAHLTLNNFFLNKPLIPTKNKRPIVPILNEKQENKIHTFIRLFFNYVHIFK